MPQDINHLLGIDHITREAQSPGHSPKPALKQRDLAGINPPRTTTENHPELHLQFVNKLQRQGRLPAAAQPVQNIQPAIPAPVALTLKSVQQRRTAAQRTRRMTQTHRGGQRHDPRPAWRRRSHHQLAHLKAPRSHRAILRNQLPSGLLHRNQP
ncbi:hypothetical protein ACR6C2_00485 [Streptomyces sp. INA 01156]